MVHQNSRLNLFFSYISLCLFLDFDPRREVCRDGEGAQVPDHLLPGHLQPLHHGSEGGGEGINSDKEVI